jgi:hypothetical protein
MKRTPLEWLMWSWRIACASYVVGVLTLLPYGSIIVWWTLILFVPLLAVTLRMTRSNRLARIGVPVLAAAALAAVILSYDVARGKALMESPVYLVLWFTGVIGPIVMYPIVVREIGRIIRSNAPVRS